MATLLRADPGLVLWWASSVECQSAVFRRHREGELPLSALNEALVRLKALVDNADVVAPTDRVRERAGRLLAAHPLRAGDALQLAAALIWCNETPQGDSFVSLDDRLREAARREGFALVPG
ncbi:MAG: PIN domain-containing protein [Candidatus Rokuibacteriota bacterium]|nr:MAG: PIN domain-containing protein [Candidatus Rokubacteria bacterium]